MFWPLISQRDRNRLYEIETQCGIFPAWFYENNPDALIENLTDRQKVIFLRGTVKNGQEWAKEVQDDFTLWLGQYSDYPGDLDEPAEVEGRKTTALEIQQANLKEWQDCYYDVKRMLNSAEKTYSRIYGKRVPPGEDLGNTIPAVNR